MEILKARLKKNVTGTEGLHGLQLRSWGAARVRAPDRARRTRLAGFYRRPKGIEDLIDFVVGRIAAHLGVGGIGRRCQSGE